MHNHEATAKVVSVRARSDLRIVGPLKAQKGPRSGAYETYEYCIRRNGVRYTTALRRDPFRHVTDCERD